MNDIREDIKRELKRQHMTRVALAKASGYADSTLKRYLQGKQSMRVDSVADICEVLGYRLALVPMEVE